MKLASSRALSEMRAVLLDQSVSGPDPVYQVFTELADHLWVNKTVIKDGKLGSEYPKTFGHYHTQATVDEKYYVAQGSGILVLQKKHLENGIWQPEIIDDLLLIKASVGDELTIKSEYGHGWSNVGEGELVLFDNWSTPHSPTDYEAIEKLHGLAYYLIEENGQPKAVPNKNYQKIAEPKWLVGTATTTAATTTAATRESSPTATTK